MRWRGRTIGPDTPMPKRRVAQRHDSPRVGDRLTAWVRVHRGGAFDSNLYPACGVIWFLHWLIPILNGYRWVTNPTTGAVRKMTRRELFRPASKWGVAGIKSWTDKHGQHPQTLEEGLRWCVAHERVAIMEGKGPAWSRDPKWHAIVRATCVKVGHPCWMKRIASLRFPRKFVANAHRSHVYVAAIWGKGVSGRARRLARTRRLERGWGALRFDATW